jgi:hypothetical protein
MIEGKKWVEEVHAAGIFTSGFWQADVVWMTWICIDYSVSFYQILHYFHLPKDSRLAVYRRNTQYMSNEWIYLIFVYILLPQIQWREDFYCTWFQILSY